MKSIFKICLVAIIVFVAGNVNAQNLKFGHIDQSALILAMPEFTEVQSKLEKEQKGMEDQYADLQKQLEAKGVELGDSTLGDLVLQSKFEEYQSLGQRIQNFQQTAMQRLGKLQMDLMQPIWEKANDAITASAKEQGVIYVFATSGDTPAVLYYSNASIDMLPFVKKRLGIQ